MARDRKPVGSGGSETKAPSRLRGAGLAKKTRGAESADPGDRDPSAVAGPDDRLHEAADRDRTRPAARKAGEKSSRKDKVRSARYALGDIVRHRVFSFRGVVFDVDPVFNNTEEWYQSIPAHVRPRKDQPFYHLLARNDDSTYQAYVSEQNLLDDAEGGPVHHPLIDELFDGMRNGRYHPRTRLMM